MLKKITVRSKQRNELIDITKEVMSAVKESKVRSGICSVYIPHTTAGVTINENADPSVKADIISELNRLIPLSGRFTHSEGNSDAHVKASLVGSSVNVIIEDGSLLLGTWQGIYFCEFDGSRTRTVYIKIISG
ncbi:MAG: YjbQ family protein [Candidatus Schekmanbacteria bacterium]|nr:YjbQ family protein [Candidatus Schekmanbacteria bacterium]